MSILDKYKKISWATDDNFVPFHHHSGDDNKNYLVDREKNEIVNFKQANDRLQERAVSRRAVLCGLGATSMIAIAGTPRYAWAETTGPNKPVIINIFLRGAMDGYYAVGPYLDQRYLNDRTTCRTTPDNGLDIGNGYALHASLGKLKTIFDEGGAAFAAGVGTFGQTRSHFDAQALVERSAPVQVRSGWLARYLSHTSQGDDTRFRAFSHDKAIIGTQQDSEKSPLTINSLKDFAIPNNYSNDYDSYLSKVFGKAGGNLGAQATETIAAIAEIQQMSKAGYTPSNGAVYTEGSSFGQGMKEIAQFIKAEKGLEAASIDFGNWDTHDFQERNLKYYLKELGDNIYAMCKDLGPERMKNVVIMTQSEFGRTISENGANGTDHGLGNFMFIVGGGIKGGKVYGDYPDLSRALNKDRDAPVNIDYRDIVSEILSKKFNAQDKMDDIFPDYTPNHLGLFS